jgi:hypothetical protein
MTTSARTGHDQLPPTISAYLAAHTARDVDAALRAFSVDGSVTDEGHTFHGTEEILSFLTKAGSEFRYTTELIGATRVDDAHWVATNRLEGDFPGGVVELDFRFTLADNLIAELVIAPR